MCYDIGHKDRWYNSQSVHLLCREGEFKIVERSKYSLCVGVFYLPKQLRCMDIVMSGMHGGTLFECYPEEASCTHACIQCHNYINYGCALAAQ